jgi:hypothetical protein
MKYFQISSVLRLLFTANVVPSSPILVTLVMKAIRSSLTSVLTRATRRNVPEDGIIHSLRRENLKSYMIKHCFIFGLPWSYIRKTNSNPVWWWIILPPRNRANLKGLQKLQYGDITRPACSWGILIPGHGLPGWGDIKRDSELKSGVLRD